MEHFEPAEEILVTNLETLKVLSDPLRGRMLDQLRARPQTVKQLASALAVSPKKLYYHINLMEQHGLIRVVDTRIVSGILERTYRAAAYLFVFDKDVFASMGGEASALPPGIGLLFDVTRNQLEQSLENHLVDLSEDAPVERRLLHTWKLVRMDPHRASAFYARLQALFDEFNSSESEPADAGGQVYRLFCVMFPARYYSGTPGQPTPPEDPHPKQ